nr:cbb3-type cytochrome c oxidase subunit I [Sinimarinibacterium flocculans]
MSDAGTTAPRRGSLQETVRDEPQSAGTGAGLTEVPDAYVPPAADPSVQREQAARLAAAWQRPRGWRRFSEVNNSAVGYWYLMTALAFFLFAGVLALLMRTQLAVPENDFLPAGLYDQMFTLHGSVMMFLFAVPIIESFAILMLPQMNGTRELPFPRLSAFGFWCFAIGGFFVCGSIFFGAAPSGGWFMYPPLTTQYTEGVGPDVWLLGLSFVEIASISAAVELMVGILKTRAPGMRIDRMPLYSWYMLVVAGMILVGFPPLIVGDLLFELERAAGWPFFDPARGGDPLLWQHLFWIFGHPEVYIIFLPAVALVAMIVPTFARTPMVGYSWIVLAAVGVGFLSFGLWVHHMFTTGMPALSLGFFSAASLAVAVPTAIQIFCFIATTLVGRFVPSVPMLFVAGALAIFVLGGLTGVMVAVAPFDFQAHDTYFVVAHLHYVLIGGMLFPVFAGLHYYFPSIAGRQLSATLGTWSFWLMFVGFNVAFLPMHVSGLGGMARRVYTYGADIGLDLLNLVSTIGAFVFAAGVALLVGDLLFGRRRGALPDNPWNAGTLEWSGSLPGRDWGMRSIPRVRSRYPLWEQKDLARHIEEGRYYLPDAEEGRRETLVTSVIDARPLQVCRVPGPGYTGLVAAVFTSGIFIFPVFGAYAAAATSAVAALLAVVWWLWRDTARIPEKPDKDAGLGLRLPLYGSGPGSIGWWGMLTAMFADAVAFASLVFVYFYFWTVHEHWPPQPGPGLSWPALASALLVGAWLLACASGGTNRRGRSGRTRGALALAALLCIGSIAAWIAAPLSHGMAPQSHPYPATVWVLVIWLVGHLGIGAAMLLYCVARSAAGQLTATHDADLHNVTLYWHFTGASGLVAFAVLALFPLVS